MKLRKAYIFGAGKRGQRLFEFLNSAGTEILGFIDNSVSKQGAVVCGRTVYSLQDVAPMIKQKNIMVVVSPKEYGDILSELDSIEAEYALYDDITPPSMQYHKGNYDDERLLAGTTALDVKKLLWDSDKLPFIPENWDEYGFKVFSQGNEDGLIQYLINHVEIKNEVFVEFGVEDYSECNTKFLLLHNNWSGLCMDGSTEAMEKLRTKKLYWQHTIEAKAAFITKDNINQLIKDSGISGDIGLLSTDIDGVDYHVLEAIDCISPRIIICEFNPVFGAKESVSVPYREDFSRTKAHFSNLYFGASLRAFVNLLKKKGYKLVCISSMRNNAFFVREDASNSIPEVSVEKSFRPAKFRESRNEKGDLTFLSPEYQRALIGDMEVIDIESGRSKRIRDLRI